jgi:hypothetical protein
LVVVGDSPAVALRYTAGYASSRRCATVEKQKNKFIDT